MPPHPLTKTEIQKYYQNKPRFNGVYSRSNLSRLKNEGYETHWIALYVNDENVIYFDNFGVKNILKKFKQK